MEKTHFRTIWQTIRMRYSSYRILLLLVIALFNTVNIHGKTYLLSVGICDYSSFQSKLNNLLLPVKDANAIINLYSHNSAVDYVLLTDRKATRENILRAIKKLYSVADTNDQVIFFFSGHGHTGRLCASDTFITYEEIKKVLSKVKCKSKFIFVDACRSGTFRIDSKNRGVNHSHSKTILFLASRNNENSIERKDMKNGFFTEYLVKGLKGNADANRDRIITTKELFDFVSTRVSIQSNGHQHPVMFGNFNDSTTVIKW